MNCKPGDLAIITHTRGSMAGTGRNVGRIVKVIRAHGDATCMRGDTFFCWWVEFVGAPGTDANYVKQQDGWFPDAYLKRIDPPQEMQNEERHERETA